MKDETEFLKVFYPCNYFKEKECYAMLEYKFGIKMNKIDKEKYSMPISKGYDSSRRKILRSEVDDLVTNQKFIERDILYLISKEHLFELYSLLKISKDKKKGGFVCAKLNRMVIQSLGEKIVDDGDGQRMRANFRDYNTLHHINFLRDDSCKVLMNERMPYAFIPFSFIKFANENPVTSYIRREMECQRLNEQRFNEKIESLSKFKRCRKDIRKKVAMMDLDKSFKFVCTIIKKSNRKKETGNNYTNLKWQEIPADDQNIYLTLVQELFWIQYNSENSESAKLNYNERRQYNKLVTERFILFFNDKSRGKKYTKKVDKIFSDYFSYLSYSQEVFRKLFSVKNKEFLTNINDYVATYLLSEKIFPTYSLLEIFSIESFRELVEEISNFENKINAMQTLLKLLVKLSRVPNLYNQITILEYYAEMYQRYDMFFYDWSNTFEKSIDYFTLQYYPVLETIFHLLVTNQCVKIDMNDINCKNALDGFVSRMNDLTDTKWENKKQDFSRDEEKIWIDYFIKYYESMEINLKGYPGRTDLSDSLCTNQC